MPAYPYTPSRRLVHEALDTTHKALTVGDVVTLKTVGSGTGKALTAPMVSLNVVTH